MGKMSESVLVRNYQIFSAVSASIAIITGITVMVGWWLHIPLLTSIVPGLVTMKPNTAVCFLLAGIALWLLLASSTKKTRLRRTKIWAPRACAVFIILIGVGSFIERTTGQDLGIDLLFFPRTLLATQVPRPGLMAAASGVAFLLLGAALLLLDWETSRKRRPAQGFALLIVLIGLISLLGYVYGVQLLFGAAGYSVLSLHTAVLFVLLGIGILCARPQSGLMSVMTSEHLGGSMLRRMFPILLILPIVIGWLRLKGQNAGYYGTEFGLALFAASSVITSAVVLWTTALWLNRADLARRQAEQRDEELAAIVDSSSDAITGKSLDGTITSWNKGAEKVYGYSESEMVGKNISLLTPPANSDEIPRILAEIRKGIPIERFETVRRRKDQALIHVSLTISPVHDREGNVVGASTVARDITERKLAEERLRQNQAQFKGIIDSAMDAVITVDQQQCVIMFNGAAEKMFGYPAAEIVGLPLERLIPQRLRSGHAEHIRNFGNTGTTSRAMGMLGSLSGLRKDGSEFPIEASISQIEVDGQKLFTAIVRDVTDRERTAQLIRQSQAQLQGIIDSAMDALITVDSGQQVVMFNLAAEKMFGCSAAEALGSKLERFIPARFRGAHSAHIKTFAETGVTSRAMGTLGALQGLRANGEEFPIEASISQIESDGKKLFTAIVRDVTERVRADRALREQASILDLAQVLVRDMDDRIVLWNRGAEKLYGYALEEALGRTSHELLRTEFPEPINAIREKLMRNGEWEGELVHRKRDGSRIVVASVWTLERHLNGQPWRILEANTDITARKRAEEAVQLAQARLLSALEGGRMGTWVWDISKNTINWDDAMATLFGRSATELADGSIEPFFSWVHPQDRERARTDIGNILQEGTHYDSEYRLQRPDRSMVWITSRGRVERDVKGNAFRMTGISVDVTDRKKIEEQLLQSQKMESLGTLAGGIAHDFNNILLAIGGNASMAIDDLPPDHPVQQSLQEIAKASARASNLVRQILTFSRHQAPDRKRITVQPVVEEALGLLRATLPARIEIRSSFAPDLPAIAADSTQLHQVIMNLCTNAARAMGENGGILEVTAKPFKVTGDFLAELAKVREGNYVRLSVSDNGCGMETTVMERIFDPFFTTQAPGHGTGLGLSVVHGIMKDHDGSISVYSEPGKGSVFHLYFPAEGAGIEQARAAAAPPHGNGEHLLYVDDEEALVMLAMRSLGRLGYQVTGHTDPARALQTFKENPGHFAAVVTDLSMPAMSGAELARQILAIRPDIPVVVTSGYIRPEDELEARRIGVRDLIQKPDTIEELAKSLNRVFSGVTVQRSN